MLIHGVLVHDFINIYLHLPLFLVIKSMVLPLKLRLFALQKGHSYIKNAPLLTGKRPSNVF